MPQSPTESRKGLIFGTLAYVMWGGFPLYFPLMQPAGAVEILAHRIVWSALTLGIVVVALGRLPRVRAILSDRRALRWLVIAAVVIAANWGIYIWGVTNGHVVETSLGYFINPLVTVALGVVILKERLRPAQWMAIGLGAVAVGVLAVDYGRLPWVAVALACSFGTYGLAKKQANVSAMESILVETAMLAPFAAAFIGHLLATGQSGFAQHGLDHAALLMSTGIATVIPLVLFSAAATRVPMTLLGILQYLAPILQFSLGVFWFHEAMPPGRWLGFAMIWVALIIFTIESISHRRRQLRQIVESSAI